MAIGDAALAKGMDIVPSSAQLGNGHEEINKTRDYIAELDIEPETVPASKLTGTVTRPVDTTSRVKADNGMTSVGVYNQNAASGSFRSVWVNNSGLFGYNTSAAKYKNIGEDYETDIDALRGISPKNYTYKDDPAESPRIGLIADELIANGLGAFCFYNEEGEVEGIHYEMLSVALWSLMKQLDARITALEAN